MIRRPPRSTRTDTLVPYTTLVRAPASLAGSLGAELGYALVEGPMRDGKPRWLVIAEGLAGKALQRYAVDEAVVHGRATGAVLEGQLDRKSTRLKSSH